MSTYSEEMLHLDSDIEGEEFTSGDGVGTDRDELGKENCNGQKCSSDITDDDIRAMEFSTKQEAIDFYAAYAHSQGFAIRKDDVKRNHENEIVARRLLCNKAGKSERKNKKNEDIHRPTMRTGCLARLRVSYDMIRKIWKVTMFEPSHNHDLTPAHFVHLIPNYRKLSEADKQIVNGLHSQGVRTCHILGFLMDQKGGHEDLGFIKKDLYNYTDHQGRVRIEDGDTFATLSYFQGKADSDSNFFSEFTFTDDERLENIFWADSTSKLDYECFGDVVAFDTTYKKNRYGKPLVIFSGYNHHGETTIFACALICDETTDTYKWVLNMFSKAMYNKYPKAVVTDADKSMREAIRVVFPNSKHRLCSWHLHRNARAHIKDKKFLEEFKTLMYSTYTPEKFESEWKRVVDTYGVSDNKWVLKTYELKQMWASAYMRDHFVCGVRTTSICEGVNSFIKKYVQNKNSLVDFLHNFERALKDYRHNELVSDFKSFYYRPVLTTSLPGFELGASKIFTSKKFKDVKKAIEDVAALSVTERIVAGNNVIFRVNVYRNKDAVFWVHLDKVQNKFLCDCRRFERRGLPCSHIISVMKYEDMDVFPESLICKRWTKTAKKDHISSFASKDASKDVKNEEKMVMFRRGALVAAFNRLCEVSCMSASDYKEALEGINSLCDKMNIRREGNVNGNNKANGNPRNVKAKGAPKIKKSHKKRRSCTHCRMPDHTMQRCPVLAKVDVDEEEGKEEDKEDEDSIAEYESDRLSVSISHKMNDKKHSVSVPNGRHGVDNIIGIKREREDDKVVFSTQDIVNKRTTNIDIRKSDASVTPNIKINIENNGVPHQFGYDASRTIKHESQSTGWNHGVGYVGNYFPMYSGIPNFSGSIFPQFPPTGILPSYSNNTTALHYGTHSSSFMERLLMDPSFYDTDSNYGKRITEFKLVTPKGLGHQGEGSNDCAVWVINWMMQQGENGYKIEVDEGSRLKIALQLTLHPFNKTRDVMLTNSLEHKQAFMKGNDPEEKN